MAYLFIPSNEYEAGTFLMRARLHILNNKKDYLEESKIILNAVNKISDAWLQRLSEEEKACESKTILQQP